jgi:hypothetical protein
MQIKMYYEFYHGKRSSAEEAAVFTEMLVTGSKKCPHKTNNTLEFTHS